MTIVDRNKIDFIYVENDTVVLEILDHLDWEKNSIANHWQMLTDKVKDYIGFIHSGQLKDNIKEKYNHESLKPCIKIVFLYQWPQLIEENLNKLKELNDEYNCKTKWEYKAQK